jgi:hypothetical protein
MTDLFYSPRLTFARAQYHIADFNKVVTSFVEGRPWTPFIDKDSEPGKHIYKVKFTRDLPEELPCILFDAVNNLRSSLDQAGYAAAIASGKTNPKSTNFPFADDLAGLNNNIDGRGVCKDLPPEIIALFRGFNPYERGDATLWALNKLCNTKKHNALVPGRLSNVAAVVTHDQWSDLAFVVASQGRIGRPVAWDAEKAEMTLMVAAPETQTQITGHFAFHITLGSIDVLARQDARQVLIAMSTVVRNILLRTEGECRRLGFKVGD